MELYGNQLPYDVLSTIIFLPLAGAFLLLLLEGERAVKITALAFTVANFLLSLPLLSAFDPSLLGFQFAVLKEWFPQLGVTYAVGVDGISLLWCSSPPS